MLGQDFVQLFQEVRAKDLCFFIPTYNVDKALVKKKNVVATFVPNCASLSLYLTVSPNRARRVRLSSYCWKIQILHLVQPMKNA